MLGGFIMTHLLCSYRLSGALGKWELGPIQHGPPGL